MKENIRHFFPGGNTSQGFYSFYKYILPQKKARKIFCLKGGPGTGKSTILKKIGMYFSDKGYPIEFHHCSSDNTSLDGVLIKNLNIALIDGTSPHVIDPITPGAVDEIVNLGEFLKESELKKYKKAIITTNKKISSTFNRVYKYLLSSKFIHTSWSNYNHTALNMLKFNTLKKDLKNKIFKKDLLKYGYDRHLFATAFTPNGIITYIDSLCNNYENIYVLNGAPGMGKTTLLKSIYKEALSRGYFVEVLHDPLIPQRIEHILIPNLNTAILTSNEINNKNFYGNQIYMENLLDNTFIIKNKNEINDDIDNFKFLLNKALNILTTAKKLHDEVEKYYINNISFDKLNNLSNNILNRLLEYEHQYKNNL